MIYDGCDISDYDIAWTKNYMVYGDAWSNLIWY